MIGNPADLSDDDDVDDEGRSRRDWHITRQKMKPTSWSASLVHAAATGAGHDIDALLRAA